MIGDKAPELEFGWIAHRLYFLAHGEEPFRLVWGLSEVNAADFGLGPMVRELTIDGTALKPGAAKLGDVVFLNPSFSATSAKDGLTVTLRPWGQYSLWGGLILVLLITTGMAYKLYKEMA